MDPAADAERGVPRVAQPTAPPAAPPEVPPDTCRNCGAHAPGHYCGNCGQETRVLLPTFTAFMREAAGRYVSFDGRFWRTMAALVARPGFLTLEYLRGRRKRYIRPARLFLVLYLVLFGVVGFVQSPGTLSDEVVFVDSDKAGTDPALPSEDTPEARARTAQAREALAGARDEVAKAREQVAREIARARREADVQSGKAPADVAVPAPGSPVASGAATTAEHEEIAILKSGDGSTFLGLDKDLNLTLRFGKEDAYLPPQVRKRWDQFKKLPRQEKAERLYVGILRYGPYAMVALLPAFALLLKLAYLGSGRRYPQRPQRYAEHLVYSAHLHAFAAVMLLALVLVPFGLVKTAILLWIIYYAMRARQVVYGGRWWAGLLRAFAIAMVYLVLLAVAMAGLVIVAVMLR